MNPSAARAAVIGLSVLVLALSGLVTTAVWHVLSPLQPLPRGLISLLTWVSSFYLGTNLIFWKAVLRISSPSISRQN
jgi:hypothetical protein